MNLAISGTERSPIYVTAVLLCDENSITVGKALMFRLRQRERERRKERGREKERERKCVREIVCVRCLIV